MSFLEAFLAHFPTGSEFASAIPVILSLIMIEGLLSVDNAMGIAAMASNLPEHQQKKALRWGIVGAYVLRGLSLAFVGFIAANLWLKAFGALYLLYLMASGLVGEEGDDTADAHGKPHVARGFIATVMAIEFMDLSLALDNVVAAVALDKRMWVICTGVFIGILALRFVAGYCIELMKRFPILEKTAFLLIGWVGLILTVELSLEHYEIHVHFGSLGKFAGILVITAATLLYSETAIGKQVLAPIVWVGKPIIHVINWVVGAFVFDPIKAYFKTLFVPFKKMFLAIQSQLRQYNEASSAGPLGNGDT